MSTATRTLCRDQERGGQCWAPGSLAEKDQDRRGPSWDTNETQAKREAWSLAVPLTECARPLGPDEDRSQRVRSQSLMAAGPPTPRPGARAQILLKAAMSTLCT